MSTPFDTDLPAVARADGANDNRADAVDELDLSGFRPLHRAAAAGAVAQVHALLQRGADPERGSKHPGSCSGLTPLISAAAGGEVAIVRALLQAGARTQARDDAGYTALHLAAELGRADIVKELLLAGADPEPVIGDVTPLGLARRGRHVQVVGLLKQLGAR